MLDNYLIPRSIVTIKHNHNNSKDVSKLLLVFNHVSVWGYMHILGRLVYTASENVE